MKFTSRSMNGNSSFIHTTPSRPQQAMNGRHVRPPNSDPGMLE